MDLETRIASLELLNRRLVRAVGLIAGLACVPFLLAAHRIQEDVVRARRIELLDAGGRVRASLSFDKAPANDSDGDDLTAWLTFYRANGQAVARYDQYGLKYYDFDSGEVRVSLRNFLGLELNDQGGNNKIKLWVNYQGEPILNLEEN